MVEVWSMCVDGVGRGVWGVYMDVWDLDVCGFKGVGWDLWGVW